ncbi:MAG: hypothetical protein NC397_10185 [Clostridium sp.]|nr:hypothetical protein [Clostridium sp.]
MRDFSDNDINEAKRRVWEMRSKAAHFVDDHYDKSAENKNSADTSPIFNMPSAENHNDDGERTETEKLSAGGKEDDKSFMVILALIMLLSREGADNTLILALLYLLL